MMIKGKEEKARSTAASTRPSSSNFGFNPHKTLDTYRSNQTILHTVHGVIPSALLSIQEIDARIASRQHEHHKMTCCAAREAGRKEPWKIGIWNWHPIRLHWVDLNSSLIAFYACLTTSATAKELQQVATSCAGVDALSLNVVYRRSFADPGRS